MNLDDRMKGLCLVCRAEFAWGRFMQGHKKCEPCDQEWVARHEAAHTLTKLLLEKREYARKAATQYIINEQLLNATTKESV